MALGDVPKRASVRCGQPATFLLAVGVIPARIRTEPPFGFPDTWQVVIDAGTAVITFLTVCPIQSTRTATRRRSSGNRTS
jgi:low affinity Fe/Cu permease